MAPEGQMLPAIALPGATLAAVDTRSPNLALQAMRRCMEGLAFGRCVLLTDLQTFERPSGRDAAGIEVLDIGAEVRSASDYSMFILNRLADYIDTEHVLLVQWDGFVINPQLWSDHWLAFDYIGAPWKARPDRSGKVYAVGNGGFSLRSKRLLRALAAPSFATRLHHPEDLCIGLTLRDELEARHGIRFADPHTARVFALENEPVDCPTFGFHGLFNLGLAYPDQELMLFIDALPASVVGGRDAFKLARTLLRSKRPVPCRHLLQRRRSIGHLDLRSRLMLLRC